MPGEKPSFELKIGKTQRGFELIKFVDRYGNF